MNFFKRMSVLCILATYYNFVATNQFLQKLELRQIKETSKILRGHTLHNTLNKTCKLSV